MHPAGGSEQRLQVASEPRPTVPEMSLARSAAIYEAASRQKAGSDPVVPTATQNLASARRRQSDL